MPGEKITYPIPTGCFLLRFGPVRFGSGHLGMCSLPWKPPWSDHHRFQVLNLPRVPWRIGMTTFSYFSDTVGLAAGEVGEGKRSGACERKGQLWRSSSCFMFEYTGKIL